MINDFRTWNKSRLPKLYRVELATPKSRRRQVIDLFSRPLAKQTEEPKHRGFTV